jgi:hypothetical protein
MFVSCECFVLSGGGLSNKLITSPEESYLLVCVVVCDIESSRMKRLWPALDRSATKKSSRYLEQIIHFRLMPCLSMVEACHLCPTRPYDMVLRRRAV